MTTESQTAFWQGYWGDVTGNITLEDSAGNLMYQWLWNTTGSGEVYSSEDSNPTWVSIVAGNTANVNYVTVGSDSAANTFKSTNTWVVGNVSVANVPSTSTYNSSGNGAFNMGILSDGADIVFVSKLYDNLNAFNNNVADFQMMVPVNETAPVTYYFWMELS